MTLWRGPIHVVAFVGTDHHPFNRLVESVDAWFKSALETNLQITCMIQYGTSTRPETAQGSAYLDRAGIESQLGLADIIVSHGGPSTIVEVLRSGKIPMVMPRDPSFGEHVDGHQQRFAAHMAKRGLITPIRSAGDLLAAFDTAMDGSRPEVIADADFPAPADSAMRLAGLVEGLIRGRGSKGRNVSSR
ncbi:glycosyltransferase [Paeniglutamicibacter cryotolerans]|uniref:UDP-N-acetylglucosamine transferase subunit ALG13 n=1 Tax=Paeniglutamicibacter cryotolerans TaxID=670079 RepID=A0A839QRV6_9MICC|nr:glycosyltransferase [Paeniglutamicibacter cryotolerans]MBB2995992.1 UDP-N-acetylglucosamine transferase subunit ALG13 [Paeniglutamicibacter cryotolerans]